MRRNYKSFSLLFNGIMYKLHDRMMTLGSHDQFPYKQFVLFIHYNELNSQLNSQEKIKSVIIILNTMYQLIK